MAFSLRNFLEEAVAQANPFDKGQTAQTVRQNRARIATQEQRNDQILKPLRQKAAQRVQQQYKAGTLNTAGVPMIYPQQNRLNMARQQRMSEILGTKGNISLADHGLKKMGKVYANTQKDNAFNTVINNAGSAIIQTAPQRIIGSGLEYTGRVLGNEGLTKAGESLSQPFRDFQAVQYENAGNKTLATAANIAGGLLTLPIAPNKGTVAFNAARFGAPLAGDTSYAIQEAGGSRTAQALGGGATGLVGGVAGSIGATKVLGKALPQNIVSKGTGRLASMATTKLLPSAVGRTIQAGASEGLENVIQQGVENVVAQKTYDPNRSVVSNLATTGLLGFGMGAGLRGGLELQDPTNRANFGQVIQGKPTLEQAREIKGAISKYRTMRDNRVNQLANVQAGIENGKTHLVGYDKVLSDEIAQLDKAISMSNARLSGQGGYIGNGEPEVPSELPERYIQEYADHLKSIESGARGGQMIPDGEGGYKRMTEHSPFYREYYAQYKRKPSNQAWLEHARKEVLKDKSFLDYANQDSQPKPVPNEPSNKLTREELDSLYETAPNRSTLPESSPPQTQSRQPSQLAQDNPQEQLSKLQSPQTPIKPENKPSFSNKVPDIDKFINEQVKLQETKPKKPSGTMATLKRKWVDTLSPAEDRFKQAVKDGKMSQETLDKIIVANGKSLRGGTMANLALKDSGIVELLDGMNKKDYDALGQALISIHSKDLRANKIETGRDANIDDAIIARDAERFKPQIEQFRKASESVLDRSVKAQLISKETADLLKKKYPNYVPMNRVLDELESTGSFNKKAIANLGRQTVVQKIKGSKKAVQNPIESMVEKIQTAEHQALRNEAALSWVDALKETGGAELVADTVKTGEHTISVFRNGEKEIYKVDPELEAAAKGLTKPQMDAFTNAIRKVTRVFKTGTTGINLPFIVTNLARDQQTALLNMKRGESQIISSIPKALMETFGHGKLYEEALRQGAISTSFDLTKPNTKQTVGQIRKRGARLGMFDKVEDAIGRSEEYTRIQQYKATKDYWLKQGLNEKDAINKATIASQQNTADFARSGDLGSILNAWLPYTNAAVQGTRAYVRSAKENPGRYALKAGATVVMPTVMTALWNTSDDDRKAVYDDVSEFEKQTSFIVVTPWAKKDEKGKWQGLVKIPKPPGISALMYPVEKAVASMKGLDPAGYEDVLKGMLGFASPLGDSVNSVVSSLNPQAFKPATEVALNKDFYTNREVVPFYMKNKPNDEQAYKNTSGTARGIAKVAGTSPLNIEHLLRGYTGEVGLQALNASDNLLARLGAIPEEQIGGRSIPTGFKRRFTEAYDKKDTKLPEGTKAIGASSKINENLSSGEVKISTKSEKNASGRYVSRDQYSAVIDAFTKSSNGKSKLDKYNTDDLRKSIKNISSEAKQQFKTDKIDPDGIKFDSRLAQEYAKYKLKLEKSNSLEKQDATRTFYRTAIKSQIDEIERDLYRLSEEKLIANLNDGTLTEKNIQRALKVEKQLFNSGLINEETLARKLNLEARGYKTAKGGSGRGRGRKGGSLASRLASMTDLYSGIGSPGSLNKTLQQLIREASS